MQLKMFTRLHSAQRSTKSSTCGKVLSRRRHRHAFT